jgi:predicted permease
LPSEQYKAEVEQRTFVNRLLAAVRQLPEVQAAGVTTSLPFGGDYSDGVIFPEGYVPRSGEAVVSPNYLSISEGYFETMHMKLVRGRLFRASDTADAPSIVIVDSRLAKLFWPHQDPIGRRMFRPTDAQHITPGPNTKFVTVVGVLDDVKLRGMVDDQGRLGSYYFPYAQQPDHGLALAVRSTADVQRLTADLRRVVAAIDPELPVFDIKTMDERMSKDLMSRRWPMLLAIGFAAVALFLSAVGVYGVLAYQVEQRAREIGIRMALGATGRGIAGMVLTESARMLGLGLATGVVGAFLAGRAIRGLLYGVGPMDPAVLVTVAALLVGVAVLAALIPAGRAQRVDPAVVLASE